MGGGVLTGEGKKLKSGRFPKAIPAALMCAAFVGLHLAVRLVPSHLKVKTGEGAVNPHVNFFFFLKFFLQMRNCGGLES